MRGERNLCRDEVCTSFEVNDDLARALRARQQATPPKAESCSSVYFDPGSPHFLKRSSINLLKAVIARI